jgi:16S rRNA C967 or C1407 C5-methylase (RsmB/RsmF family)
LHELVAKRVNNPRLSIPTLLHGISHDNRGSRKEFQAVESLLTQIIRYWNAVHFILQKTNRSLKNVFPDAPTDAWLYIITYLVHWEHQLPEILLDSPFSLILDPIKSRKYHRFAVQVAQFDWDKALVGKTARECLSIKESMPTFIIDQLLSVLPFPRLQAELHALNCDESDSQTTLRINKFTLGPDSLPTLLRNMEQNRIQYQIDPHFPDLIHISRNDRKKIMRTDSYRRGWLLFQDKASLSVVACLDPQPQEVIWDMCAAPGMKSALIQQHTAGLARLISSELRPERTTMMAELLPKLKIPFTGILNADGINVPLRSECKFDRILLDAPCMGSGTFFSDPDIKSQQTPQFLDRNRFIQERLLKEALSRLTTGGILVYSTCSLYPEEGEYQIQRLMRDPDFSAKIEFLELPKWVESPYSIPDLPTHGLGRLFPSLHHTQGFFIAKMRKKAD